MKITNIYLVTGKIHIKNMGFSELSPVKIFCEEGKFPSITVEGFISHKHYGYVPKFGIYQCVDGIEIESCIKKVGNIREVKRNGANAFLIILDNNNEIIVK